MKNKNLIIISFNIKQYTPGTTKNEIIKKCRKKEKTKQKVRFLVETLKKT